MKHFFHGAAGTLAVLGLVSLGAFCGWKARGSLQQHNAVPEASEEERRRIEAEQQAFSSMMGYNIETAYGMDRGAADFLGGEG